MKTAFIIHGYNGDTLYTFGPWLKEVLEKKGYTVYTPEFPIRLEARYNTWSKILDTYKHYFNADTIVVAHSIGNPFIMQYLANNNISVKAYISVAGFCKTFAVPDRDDITTAIEDFKINESHTDKIKELVKYRYSIYSDNDHCVPIDILKDLPNCINSIPVFIPGVGHMGNRENTISIPKLEEIILEITKK